MYDFQKTHIWQRTLSPQKGKDPHAQNREFLRVEYESFRENAAMLANEIHRVLPEYTVHDITHIDSLWDSADLIVPDEMSINPAEAFVLGGAFLLHDLGMAVAAYPGGMEDVKKEQIWIDTVISLLKKESGRNVSIANISLITEDMSHIATEKTLRYLHAQRAEQLAKMSWNDDKGQTVYLLSDTELRSAFGTIIGLIAHSHWWRIDEIDKKLSAKRGVLNRFPNDWTIDPLKLACILRVADAMQIDDRRAPSFLKLIRKPIGISNDHWSFQNKISRPHIENNRLVFTSKEPFTANDIDAWWLCYDTLRMIDNELAGVDSLFASRQLHLSANGVASINDINSLSRLILVAGWQPIDTRVRVNNVVKLVRSLGGEQLYGDNIIVPLREMIQNASDAIRARRMLEGLDGEFGDIIVSLGNDGESCFLEVEDNGVGMSREVLTQSLLDFGQSFWGTEFMHSELPGLESSGFCSTGKFGIGFFSLFMWGKHVKVISNRYDKGREDTLVLEFVDGIDTRPILRTAQNNEYIKSGGTRIRIWIEDELVSKILKYHTLKKVSLLKRVQQICPAIDCNVYVQEKSVRKIALKANDWITIPVKSLIMRLESDATISIETKENINYLSKSVEIIKNEEGIIVGRAAVLSVGYDLGCITIGGLVSNRFTGIVGILVGNCSRASRDQGIPLADENCLYNWCKQQSSLIEKNLTNTDQRRNAATLQCLCGSSFNLNIAIIMSKAVSYDELVNMIRHSNNEQFFIVGDYYSNDYGQIFKFNDNIILVRLAESYIIRHWSANIDNYEYLLKRTLAGRIIHAFAEAWECDVYRFVKNYVKDGENNNKIEIGTIDGRPLLDSVDYIIKRPPPNAKLAK